MSKEEWIKKFIDRCLDEFFGRRLDFMESANNAWVEASEYHKENPARCAEYHFASW